MMGTQLNNVATGLITPVANTINAGLNAVTKAFQWFILNPVYAIAGFYVFMVALKGGSFKIGSKASTNVKS